MNAVKTGLFVVATCAVTTVAAVAQTGVPRVAMYDDWSVFSPAQPRECFTASAPTKTRAERGGAEVTVRRSAIRLYVTNRPEENTKNEVSFTGGYPFKDSSTVSVQIGSETYEMFTEGEYVWPESVEQDKLIVAAMRRGSTAVLRAVSSRGTNTIDTFSLIGFSDAVKDADQRCGQ